MKKICVIGSLNIDLTVTIPRFHVPGESLIGSDFATFAGGKGGNQAVALGRLGADVSMVGMLGADANGALYRQVFEKEHVNAEHVLETTERPTGVALIEVSQQDGNNRIAVVPGANFCLRVADIEGMMDFLLGQDILLLQLEIPLDTAAFLIERLHAAGKTVILDPAPAQAVPERLFASVDYCTPNETELAFYTGVSGADPESAERGARKLQQLGVRGVIVKMGDKGALLVREKAEYVPGFAVNALDTTAAGDSFNAGFAFGLAEGMEETEALRFANAVAAISTTSMGAQAAMCSRAQAEKLLAK